MCKTGIFILMINGPCLAVGINNAPLPVNETLGTGTYCKTIGLSGVISPVCTTTDRIDRDGLMDIKGSAKYSPGVMGSYVGRYTQAYAPFTGGFRDKIYICPVTGAGLEKCTMAKSTAFLYGASIMQLNSTEVISAQNPDAGGPASAYAPGFAYSFCQILEDENGREWASTDATSCSDGRSLPLQPAVCTINETNALDVNFGEIDRKKIAIIGQQGDEGNIVKTVMVTCSGDLAANVKTSFRYTPVTFGAQQMVRTENSNLGVAIIYQGKAMGPSDEVEEVYELGATPINVEFEMVRNNNVSSSEIATGAFSASAVMIMTQQ